MGNNRKMTKSTKAMDKTIRKTLEANLRGIFDDDEFVLCVISHLTTDEQRQAFIDYIKNHPDATSEEITLMSISTYRNELSTLQ